MSKENAKKHIDEAIEALSIEAYRASADSDLRDDASWRRLDPVEATVAEELFRVDSALGPKGQSMFFGIGESIKEAMIALCMAKKELD